MRERQTEGERERERKKNKSIFGTEMSELDLSWGAEHTGPIYIYEQNTMMVQDSQEHAVTFLKRKFDWMINLEFLLNDKIYHKNQTSDRRFFFFL